MATTVDTKQIIFSLIDVSKIYPPKRQVLKDIHLSFYLGAKIGLIGDNGSGKSTLLKIIAGLDEDHTGELTRSKGYDVGLLEQEPKLDPEKTVKQVVEEGVAETKALLEEYEKVSASFTDGMDPDAMEKLLDKQGKLQERIEAAGAWELDNKLEVAMDALRCPPGEQKVGTLSGGEKRRVALCRLLLLKPAILLLDEPTNHLDAETVEWLEHHLRQYEGTVIIATHDRYFLDNVTEWILELRGGVGYPFKGNYDAWLEQRTERLRREEKEASKFQKTLERELEWVRGGAKGRQAKSKARLSAYEEMLKASPEESERDLQIYIPPGPRLGDEVVEFKGVTKSFGDKLLFEGLSLRVPKGAIVGIVGPNGAGKTTLFRMLTGQEKPDAGTISLGETVKLSYVDQERSALPVGKNLWEAVTDGLDKVMLGKREVNSRAYVASFNFTGPDQQKPVDALSGGERNRAHLARMLRDPGNVLLLDEPTNDLDIHTLRALELGLANYAGCAFIISHDRWFLDRLATHILAFEGDSQVRYFEGGWTDYEADYKKRMGEDVQPRRIHFKKLTR
ncbi:MAG: energy-dependent translational throttle protein EttA [Elusimicrobia bacterium]|nr:energy-dependent translational throttle protein EttA [Elusimicrobiota bacterium]